ncbi:MAG: response regulator [Telluria sp.]
MKPLRVLVADDHALLREGLCKLLGDHPDLVVAGEAENGHALLALLRRERFDVLLLDMAMPGRSGLDLLRQVRLAVPDLPVLILSMQKDPQYAVRALKAGARGYLCKDSASAELVRAIRKVAAGGTFVGHTIAENMAQGLTQGSDQAPHEQLTDREFEVFRLLASGLSATAAGRQLHLSIKTISSHKGRILQKMGLATTADMIRYAVRHHLVDEESLHAD